MEPVWTEDCDSGAAREGRVAIVDPSPSRPDRLIGACIRLYELSTTGSFFITPSIASDELRGDFWEIFFPGTVIDDPVRTNLYVRLWGTSVIQLQDRITANTCCRRTTITTGLGEHIASPSLIAAPNQHRLFYTTPTAPVPAWWNICLAAQRPAAINVYYNYYRRLYGSRNTPDALNERSDQEPARSMYCQINF